MIRKFLYEKIDYCRRKLFKKYTEKSKFKKKIQKIFFGTGVALIVKTKKKTQYKKRH